jgi:RNA polymerase sigma factor
MRYDSINERVVNIKDNESEINILIDEYKPFIAKCVERVTGRYVRYGEDDELSIALLAFVEAIKSYNIEKGNFLAFSQNVIKRRLIDFYRKEKKHNNVISLNQNLREDEEDTPDLTTGEALDRYSVDIISEYRRLELEDLKKELSNWDISFFELINASPKHDKTRKIYSDIVKYILSQPELVAQIKQKKYLPIAEIEKNTGIPRKKIERARKYILAVTIILTGDYQYIKDYIDLGVIQ